MSTIPLRKRVLVVDDEPLIRRIIADALCDSDLETRTAANGADALEVLRDWMPHAIVLDLMMPRLDGTGFLELLRLNPRYARLPVLLVTAAYDGHQAGKSIGARAVITKPFEIQELVDTVIALTGGTQPPLPPRASSPDGTLKLYSRDGNDG